MTPTTTLLEPSFADLIAAIERAPELTEQQRRQWICSLRQVAKWSDRPAEVILARWNAVRVAVIQLHHVRLGVTADQVTITGLVPASGRRLLQPRTGLSRVTLP